MSFLVNIKYYLTPKTFLNHNYFPAIHQAKQSQLVTVADLMALVLADSG